MTTKLQTYPKYKPSGIDWLGDVPGGWQIAKFKELFRVSNERVRDDSSTELPLSVSGYRGVEPRDVASMEGQMPSEDVAEYRIVRKGQLAVNTMWLNFTGLGVSEYEGYVSPAYRSYNIKPRIDKRYAHHLLRSPLYVQKYTSLLYGVRPNSLQVKTYDFEHIEILLPPLKTQKRIADFLDEKTKIIDELLAKKERLIELLKEKRTSLITHYMTKAKGEISKIKACSILNPGKRNMPVLKPDEMVSFVPMEALSEMGVLEPQERMYQEVKNGFTYFENGDVVLAKITPCYENGKAGVMRNLKNNFGFGTTEFLVLRPNAKILPEYLYFLIFSDKFRKSGEVEMRGTAGQKRVTNLFVRNYEFTLPLIEEQKVIIENIKTEIRGILDVVEIVFSQVEKLKEYRSSLIYHAVTGKIKI